MDTFKMDEGDKNIVGRIEQLSGEGRGLTPEYVDSKRKELIERARYENLSAKIDMLIEMVAKLYLIAQHTTDNEILNEVEEKISIIMNIGKDNG